MTHFAPESQARAVVEGGAAAHREPTWYRAAEIAFLILLFAAAFLCRLWPVWQVHFWDEASYLQNAEVICCGKNNYSELWMRPPLLSILYAGAFMLWHSQFAASLLAAALNALAPVFAYWAGKLLWDRVAGGIAALFVGFSPMLVSAGNNLLTDHPALTMILLALCVLLKAVSTNSNLLFALAGFACALSGLMRFTSLITIFIFPLYLLWTRRRFLAVPLFGLGFLAGFGPYLLWSRLRYGSFLGTLRAAEAIITSIHTGEPISYYAQHFSEILPWLTLVGVVLWFGTWLLGTRVQWERQDGELVIRLGRRSTEPQLASDAILLWWIVLVLAYFLRLSHKEPRYMIPLVTPWVLLAGRGLATLLRPHSLRIRAIVGALLLAGMAYSFAPTFARFRGPLIAPWISDEKRAADYLNQNAKSGSVLYSNFNYPIFAYYTNLTIQVIAETDMSFYNYFPTNMPRDGYVILHKGVALEPKPIWADMNPHFRRLQEFPDLIIYEYRTAGFAQPPSAP